MGHILSYLQSRQDYDEHLFIDFENAEPGTDEEKKIYAAVATVLDRGPRILERLRGYSGCEEFIRRAITTPGAETEEVAWEAIIPAVDQLKEFYDFSLDLESSFPKLLIALCKNDPKDSLASQQALAKQLADVLDFVLRFDDQKMVNPAIQNDFSYYRRTLNRMKMSKKDLNLTIRDELANRMSLFFAYPTPMMKVLSETTVKFLSADSSGVPRDNVVTALATIANVCHTMVDTRKFESPEVNLFCLRAMTGAIILYDHIHPNGAFTRKSQINIKGAVTLLKNYGPSIEGLVNALRFTTIHLNDPETPNSIKQLLA